MSERPSEAASGAPAGPDPAPPKKRRPIPVGYRQGVITAITVFIGFSFGFLQYWAFQAEGRWTARDLLAVAVLLTAVALQIYTLFRSLQVRDDDEHEYGVTVRWFVTSVSVMFAGMVMVAVMAAF